MRKFALVFAGGFCGALARYLLAPPLLRLADSVTHTSVGGFPYDILLINLSGAFALGLLYGLAERGTAISPDVRLLVGTGFLGAYTTFSTFTIGGDSLLFSGAVLTGMVYLCGSVLLGITCVQAGHATAELLARRQRIRARALMRVRRRGPARGPHATHALYAGHSTAATHTTGTLRARHSGSHPAVQPDAPKREVHVHRTAETPEEEGV